MKTILQKLWEEPVLGAVFLVMLVRHVVLPLASGEPLDYSLIGDGIEDLMVVALGVGVRQLVTPTTKKKRLAEERRHPPANREVPKAMGRHR